MKCLTGAWCLNQQAHGAPILTHSSIQKRFAQDWLVSVQPRDVPKHLGVHLTWAANQCALVYFPSSRAPTVRSPVRYTPMWACEPKNTRPSVSGGDTLPRPGWRVFFRR